MKSAPSLKVVTHALAVGVGGALFILLGREQENAPDFAPGGDEEELITTTTRGVRITSTSRNTIAQLISEQREADLESESTSSLSLREFSLETIKEQKKSRETEREEHQRLLALAKQYELVEDLSAVLLEALIADNEDACRAIFLEWYRRDPSAAFDAVAIRENWRTWYLGASEDDSAVFHGIPTSELIAQATDKNRPKDFRETMLYHLGHRFSNNDDLQELTKSLPRFEKKYRDQLLWSFLSKWVPDDGVGAARFIAEEMPPSERFLFLRRLSEGSQFLPYEAWTAEFGDALMQQDLGLSAELRADLVKEATQSAKPIDEVYDFGLPSYLSQLNNEDDEPKPEPPPPPPPGLDHHLYFAKDYPQLFAEGEISPDEIVNAMARSVGHPLSDQELREVFAHLAPHHPNQAIEWARSRLPPDSLPHDTASTLAYLSGMIRADDTSTIPSLLQSGHLDDPRASRLVQWLDAFHPHLQAGADDTFDHNLRILQEDLHEWTTLAPEAADKATSVLPRDHAVWTVPDRN